MFRGCDDWGWYGSVGWGWYSGKLWGWYGWGWYSSKLWGWYCCVLFDGLERLGLVLLRAL